MKEGLQFAVFLMLLVAVVLFGMAPLFYYLSLWWGWWLPLTRPSGA